MPREELADDLAYARNLAEEGRHAPLIGGGYLLFFGVLLAICYSLHWGFITGLVEGAGARSAGLIWLGFGGVAAIGVIALRRRTRKLPGGSAVANRVGRHVWQGVAIAIFVVVLGTVLRTLLQGDASAPNAIMAVGFGAYGIALYATAAVSEQAWLRAFAVVAWLLSGAMWLFMDTPWTYLLAAGGSVTVLALPGLLMLRREPDSIV